MGMGAATIFTMHASMCASFAQTAIRILSFSRRPIRALNFSCTSFSCSRSLTSQRRAESNKGWAQFAKNQRSGANILPAGRQTNDMGKMYVFAIFIIMLHFYSYLYIYE